MKAFLEKWGRVQKEKDSKSQNKPDDQPAIEPLHFALKGKAILGKPAEEPCLVGCRLTVRFYWQEGTGYGYCSKCDTHQRIETRKQ